METSKNKLSKAALGKRNRNKGNNAERYYAKFFREELGYDRCRTSREGSRLYDESGIDLMGIPVLIQIKAGRQQKLNYSQVLQGMDEKISKNFPVGYPEPDMPKVILHHKQGKTGVERTAYDQLVIMTFNTFIHLLNNQK